MRLKLSVTTPDRAVILSSGRCGSTMLSDLIAQEPHTLSAQESLSPLRGYLARPTSESPITGAEYWKLLSHPPPQWIMAVRIGALPPEIRYPASGRWAGNLAALPPILAITLPALSPDPDQLFDILGQWVPLFPPQPAAAHHQMLLDLLASVAGRSRWVERTAGSTIIAGPILKNFSIPKVIYLTRNLADTALSMSRHIAYQIAALQLEFQTRYGTDPFREPQVSSAELPEEMRALLPDRLTAEALRAWSQDVSRYERVCGYFTKPAERALAGWGPPHLLRLRYEDLLAEPVDQLTRLGDFLGFADTPSWVAQAAGMIRQQASFSPPMGRRQPASGGRSSRSGRSSGSRVMSSSVVEAGESTIRRA
jgi:putative sulfotransferase